jgi:hypothetical protein
VLANDVDLNIHDIITLDIDNGPQHGDLTLDNKDGSFTYTPDANFFGLDTFVYYFIALPPGGSRSEYVDTATVTITVHPKYQYYFPSMFK